MDLVHYLRILQRWWWLMLIGAVLLGGLNYVRARSQNPIYQSQVKIFIGGYLADPNPGSGEISTGANLATTYGTMVRFRPFLEATIQNLGLQMTSGALSGRITTSTIPGTSILVITVTDSNPVRAANIANELADQLINNSPTNLSPEEIQNRQLVQEELTNIGIKIRESRAELQAIQELLTTSTSEVEKARLQLERDAKADEIVEFQALIASMSNSLLALGTPVNTLEVVDPALIPQGSINEGVNRSSVMLSALVGAAIAFVFGMGVEYLDDSLRTPEDIRETLRLNVLAGIVKFGNKKDTYKQKLITLYAPNSTPAESYRALRTHLLYGGDIEVKTRLIITSANISEGKSVTAANLAVALAQAEMNVVIVDADLRRPRVHEAFGMDNRVGVSNLFRQRLQPEQLFTPEQIYAIMQPTDLPYLKVITSGPMPANPAELLGLQHMRKLCESLERGGTDIIIFDTPPVLAVIDTLTLASNVKADIVLVVQAGRTRRSSALRVLQEVKQVNASVVGTVLNRITRQSNAYYEYYSYGNYSKNGRK